VLSQDFKSTELEIGVVEEPKYSEKEVQGAENPLSRTGAFRMLRLEEIDERLQAIADSG
jgi:hypothetical protein